MDINIKNLEYLKEKKELISVILLGGSALLIALMFVKVSRFFVQSAQAETIIAKAIMQNDNRDAEAENVFANTNALVSSLRTSNLFVPYREPVRETVVREVETPPVQTRVEPLNKGDVSGVVGNMVRIGDRWYSEGETVNGARIVAIKPNSVIIEANGQQTEYSPLDAPNRVVVTNMNNRTNGISVLEGILGPDSATSSLLEGLTSSFGRSSGRGGRGGGMGGFGGGGMGGGFGGGGMGGGGMGGFGGGGMGGGFGGGGMGGGRGGRGGR